MKQITASFDPVFYEYIDMVNSLVINRETLQKEFLDIVTSAVLRLLVERTPKDSEEFSKSWRVFERGVKFVVIGTDMQDLFQLVTNGQKAYTQVSKSGKKLHFFIGGQEFFRVSVKHPMVVGNEFFKDLTDGLDAMLNALILSLVKKYWKVFADLPVPDVNVNNVTKTVGLTGTNISRSRGRGRGGHRISSGQKSLTRRLGRRRHTGHFITSKSVNVG